MNCKDLLIAGASELENYSQLTLDYALYSTFNGEQTLVRDQSQNIEAGIGIVLPLDIPIPLSLEISGSESEFADFWQKVAAARHEGLTIERLNYFRQRVIPPYIAESYVNCVRSQNEAHRIGWQLKGGAREKSVLSLTYLDNTGKIPTEDVQMTLPKGVTAMLAGSPMGPQITLQHGRATVIEIVRDESARDQVLSVVVSPISAAIKQFELTLLPCQPPISRHDLKIDLDARLGTQFGNFQKSLFYHNNRPMTPHVGEGFVELRITRARVLSASIVLHICDLHGDFEKGLEWCLDVEYPQLFIAPRGFFISFSQGEFFKRVAIDISNKYPPSGMFGGPVNSRDFLLGGHFSCHHNNANLALDFDFINLKIIGNTSEIASMQPELEAMARGEHG